MAGSVLGVDQVRKVNAAYAPLLAHVRALLAADRSPYGLLKVHHAVESLDTTEMYHIFAPLSFLSPVEKKALVRAAVYEILAGARDLAAESAAVTDAPVPTVTVETVEAPKTFTPPPFRLNVNGADKFHGAAPADINVAKPVVTSTHTPKVAEMAKQGDQIQQAEQSKRDAAVKAVRETPAKDVK